MARNVQISDSLHRVAKAEAAGKGRSASKQIEHWAKMGMAAERAGVAPTDVDAAIELTRRIDILDVQSGKRKASYFHFIPPEMARNSKVNFKDSDP